MTPDLAIFPPSSSDHSTLDPFEREGRLRVVKSSLCYYMSDYDTPVRVLSFIKKDPRITSEEFQRYWREVHAPRTLEYMRKYGVQFYSQVRALGSLDTQC
jgi:EthD domain